MSLALRGNQPVTKNAFQGDEISRENRYRYDKLPYDDSIRLLRLCPDDQIGFFAVEVYTCRISDAPSYKALSYVWGDPAKKHIITCNGKTIDITENLWRALHRICGLGETTLWADALCIDQNNPEERNHQVQCMGDIYRNATEVLIHLDDGLESDAEALSELIIRCKNKTILETYLRAGYDFGPWNRFWEQAWFTRAYVTLRWTVQEVGLARKAVILLGRYHFEWDAVMRFSRLCLRTRKYWENYSTNKVGMLGATPQVWASFDWKTRNIFVARNIQELAPERFFLYLCMDPRFHQHYTADPRDMIYAFLSHPYAMRIQPDYRKNVTDIYLEFATIWLNTHKTATLLQLAQKTRAESGQNIAVPSWCPVWINRYAVPHPIWVSLGGEQFSAGLGRKPEFPFEIKNRLLNVQGLIFDTVSLVSSPILRQHIRPRGSLPDLAEPLQTNPLWKLFSWAFLHATNSSPDLPEPFTTLARTLTGGFFDLSESASRACVRSLPCWDPFQKSSAIGGGLIDDQAGVAGSPLTEGFRVNVDVSCWGRCFFVTGSGRIGLGSPAMKVGDACVVIIGAEVPFIIRSNGISLYELIGDSYIDGAMKGEILDEMEKGELTKETIGLV